MGKWLQQMPLHQKVGDLPPLRRRQQTWLEFQVRPRRSPETGFRSASLVVVYLRSRTGICICYNKGLEIAHNTQPTRAVLSNFVRMNPLIPTTWYEPQESPSLLVSNRNISDESSIRTAEWQLHRWTPSLAVAYLIQLCHAEPARSPEENGIHNRSYLKRLNKQNTKYWWDLFVHFLILLGTMQKMLN